MPSVTLEQVLACPNLPSLPTVAIEVLRLASDRNVALDQIARVVQHDPALCVRVLKTVNSSFYGLPQPCPTITRALTYLGLNTVKSLVLGFSLVEWAGTEEKSGEHMREYWRRSVFSAAASRRLAHITHSCDAEEAFLSALMQDIGMLAIRRVVGPAYGEICAQTDGDHSRLPGLERKAFGFDHAQVGAALAERWRLPPMLVEAIRDHHLSPAALRSKPELVKLVGVCNYMVTVITGSDASSGIGSVRRAIGELFNLTPAVVDSFIAATDDAHEVANLLMVCVNPYPDIGGILAQAEEIRLQHQLEIQRESERLQQSNTDLARQALLDGLTGVGNRKQFDAELEKGMALAKSAQKSLAVLMLDADRFKQVNDTYGHRAGDVVLVEVARRMAAQVKYDGMVCRYGGEEFAVILPGASRKQAAQIAEAIRIAVATEPIDLRSLQGPVDSIPVTVSLGVAAYEHGTARPLANPSVLVQAADKALYAAKNSGRNCVRVFSPRETQAQQRLPV